MKKVALMLAALLVSVQPSFAVAPDVFGTVSIEVNAPIGKQWTSVKPSIDKCVADPNCGGPEMVDFLRNARSLNDTQKMMAVNKIFNHRIKYQRDIDDEWTGPAETFARGYGDCEDYAILKMAVLIKLGIPESLMSINVVKIKDIDVYHAVLSISTAYGFEVLDNQYDEIYLDTNQKSYVPLFSFSENKVYLQGNRIKTGG